MKRDKEESILYSQTITDFITVVGEYCVFVENTSRFDKKDFLNKTRKLLPLLYLKGSLLPKFDSNFDDENEKGILIKEVINNGALFKSGEDIPEGSFITRIDGKEIRKLAVARSSPRSARGSPQTRAE